MENRQAASTGEKVVRFDTMRALVIDEDEILGKYQLSMLKRLGIRGEWTAEKDRAVELLRDAHENRQDFTICLVDWQTGGSGEEMVRFIREQFERERIRIAAVSSDMDSHEKAMLAAGADYALARPLSQSGVYQLMSSLVIPHTKDTKPSNCIKTNPNI
jgi:DNA-binding response OmpR family regulator